MIELVWVLVIHTHAIAGNLLEVSGWPMDSRIQCEMWAAEYDVAYCRPAIVDVNYVKFDYEKQISSEVDGNE